MRIFLTIQIVLAIITLMLVLGALPVAADGDHTGIDNMCNHGWNCPPSSDVPFRSLEWWDREHRWKAGWHHFRDIHDAGASYERREERARRMDISGSPAEQANFWAHLHHHSDRAHSHFVWKQQCAQSSNDVYNEPNPLNALSTGCPDD